MHFNVAEWDYFFYWRDAVSDPRIAASTFTFEWRHELVRAGYYDMGYGREDTEIMLRFEGYTDPVEEYFEFGEFNPGEQHVEIPISLGKGTHTYRFVKKEDRSELYVDGTLTAIYHVPAFILDYVELDGHGFYGPYEGYWEHAAYTRGAYTPAELPSPGTSTTTCVEVAGVPNWKQFNDGTNTWWDDIYDHTNNQIKKSGCALTAVAEVITKLGFNKNPGGLNDLLKATGNGFTGRGYVNFGVVASTASLEYTEYGDNLTDRIHMQLQTGTPVILKLWSLKEREDRTRPSHFVTAVGKCGDTIYINDPGHSSIYIGRPTLNQYLDRLPVNLRKIVRLLYYY